MNAKFHPAMKAIKAGELDEFKNLIAADPSLVTARSTRSHPTLLHMALLTECGIRGDAVGYKHGTPDGVRDSRGRGWL